MLRLFTGLSLPRPLCQQLHLLQGGIPGARWMDQEGLHITLSFIGDVSEDVAEEADDALSAVRAPGFNLALQGIGNFSQGPYPKVLWAGVAHSDALHLLRDKTENALERARVPFEKRKYTPHVTLARLNRPDTPKLAEFMQHHAGFSSAPFDVAHFILYQSTQTKNGSVYETLKSYPLT